MKVPTRGGLPSGEQSTGRHGDSIIVEELVSALADSTSIRLIAGCEPHGEDEDRLFSEEALLTVAHGASPSQRIHRWTRTQEG